MQMHQQRWIQLALCTGLLWFLVGIAWAPSNKLYQQGIVLAVWLPALIALWGSRGLWGAVWRESPLFCAAILALCVWAAMSLFWTVADDPLKALKRIAYVMLFLVAFPLLQTARPQAIGLLLRVATIGLALAALWSFYLHFYAHVRPFGERLSGIGEAGHPILGGYIMALAAVWGLQFIPRGLLARVIWAVVLLVLFGFVVLTQSRGACLALLFSALSMPLWSSGRRAWLIAGGVAVAAVVGMLRFASWFMERGLSYRPEIFVESVRMMLQRPWLGLGIGSDYRVVTANYPEGFDHSHNLFTHIGIELGLVGLLLWLGVWICTLLVGWRERATLEGRLLLGSVLLASVAVQFDAASIWEAPRAEWFVTWLPVGLALALVARTASVKMSANSKIASQK